MHMLDTGSGSPPRRTADPAEAFALVRSQGVAILTGIGASRDHARDVALNVLAPLSPVVPDPAPIKEGGGNADRAYRGGGTDEAQNLVPFQYGHTDGYSYGDRYPDYIFLLSTRPATAGGASLAVDTYPILDATCGIGRLR